MTPADLRALARVRGALLPHRTMAQCADAPRAANAVAERLETAGLTAGVEERAAVMMADSLAGSLRGWGGRYGNRDEWTGKRTAILNLACGGQGEDEGQLVPHGAELTDAAMAQLLSWALLVELEDGGEAAGTPAVNVVRCMTPLCRYRPSCATFAFPAESASSLWTKTSPRASTSGGVPMVQRQAERLKRGWRQEEVGL